MPEYEEVIPGYEDDKKITKTADMVGVPMKTFRVIQTTEVYKAHASGARAQSIGCVDDVELAAAFAEQQEGKCDTRQVVLLTDGTTSVILGELVELLDKEVLEGQTRNLIFQKLTPAERKLMERK